VLPIQIEFYGRYLALRIQNESCLFCVFGFELYADLPVSLTIVHCDGTYILSLHNNTCTIKTLVLLGECEGLPGGISLSQPTADPGSLGTPLCCSHSEGYQIRGPQTSPAAAGLAGAYGRRGAACGSFPVCCGCFNKF
jgi:hypothetical protein